MFVLLGLSCFGELLTYLLAWLNPNQTNRRSVWRSEWVFSAGSITDLLQRRAILAERFFGRLIKNGAKFEIPFSPFCEVSCSLKAFNEGVSQLGHLDSRVVFTLDVCTSVCYSLGHEVDPWWQLFFFGSSITSTLNFQRRQSEGRWNKNYYYYYLLRNCWNLCCLWKCVENHENGE